MKLALTYVVTEHLQEPCVTTRRYTFQDASVGYEWSYEGPHPDPRYARRKQKNAVTRIPEAIVGVILKEQARLFVDATVERAAGNPRKSSHIDLRLEVDGREHHLRVDGPAPDAANPCAVTQAVDAVVAALDRALRA